MKFTFVKKNWEKMTLGFILALFILSLIWLVDLFYKSEEARANGVTVIVNKIPYKNLKPAFYDFNATLSSSILWMPSEKRELDTKDEFYIVTYTDFMRPFKISRSNAPKADGKLIPYEYYKLGFCPITKDKLIVPDAGSVEKTQDSDGDGIPDLIEKKYGFNPANPADANYDLDNDSFTNLQEYLYNPEGIDNPKIHPPLVKRLVLLGISKAKVPFLIKNIVKSGKDKTKWNIQVNFDDPNITPSTQFLKIGATVELPNISYKITDIVEHTYEKLDPNLGAMIEYDDSAIILQTSKGEKLQAQVNKYIYEKDNLVTVKDIYTGEEYKVRHNASISLGNSFIGIEEYELKDVIISETASKESLVFQRDEKNYTVRNSTDYMRPIASIKGIIKEKSATDDTKNK
ncbi:MAG: hypothetical protein WCR55_00300 [Lentisphaerota bacterium]